jgi:ligand-binding sensor domain-containing protein
VIVDKHGEVWVGLGDTIVYGKGSLGRGRSGAWERVDDVDPSYPFPDAEIAGLAVSPGGTVWVSARLDGVASYADGSWTQHALPSELGDAWLGKIAVGGDETAWLGTSNGLVELSAQESKVYAPDNSAIAIAATSGAVFVDSQGRVWTGGSGGFGAPVHEGGLIRFDGTWKTFGVLKSGLSTNFILSIEEGPDGAIWVGTPTYGVDRLDSATAASE